MIRITSIDKIDDKKHIALLDTSSISFMQGLKEKGIEVDAILVDYDLILIPEWVLAEINDAEGRADYVQQLIDAGHPIYSIAEEKYSDLVNNEEGNLYQIVLASTCQIGRIKSYLRRFVEKDDLFDMDAYKEWINKLYDEWPIPGSELSSGRVKKKNAGYYSLVELGNSVYLFPFEIRLNKESIMMDSRFSMNTFGGELSVALIEVLKTETKLKT